MDDKERIKQRKKRQRKRRRQKAKKTFLIILSIIVLFIAAFLITTKICNPDFKIKSIISEEKAQQVVKFVKEDVLKQTTTTTQPTTKPTTTRPPNYDYAEFSDFAFDTSLQGNQLGNLLNKTRGAVTFSAAYVYYSIDNSGIYRFEPNEESNAKVRVNQFNFKYLNVLGDYIYYIETDTNVLARSKVGGGDSKGIAQNISFAYLYNDKIYYIGTDNKVGFIDINTLENTVLYTGSVGKKIKFVGISLSRVFFTQYDDTTKKCEYICVSLKNNGDRQFFRDDTNADELINMQLEGGYFYYYLKQDNGTFNLIRQKFGSEKTVVLIKNCSLTDYPVIYENRLYYSELDGSMLRAKELNMNSDETKIMLSLGSADSTVSAGVGFGYQYIYLFGKPSENEETKYAGSCIYTSSSNENRLVFYDGGWHY